MLPTQAAAPRRMRDASVRFVAASSIQPDPHQLGVVLFGAQAPNLHPDTPLLSLPIPTLGEPARAEVWTSAEAVTRGRHDGIAFAHDSSTLFGAIALPEAGRELDRSARNAYSAIVRVAREQGFPHLLRMWNHVSSINEESAGLERYRRFSVGRAEALETAGYRLDDDLPAASAVGAAGDGLWISFVAARTPVVQVENPRQVSAYCYPQRYGPRSPSFSRATVQRDDARWRFFLSGTASIVGHESRHAGDVPKQLEETLANIEQLLQHAAATHGFSTRGLSDFRTVKTYLRNPDDLAVVEPRLIEAFGGREHLLFVHADVCRRELLLEIEGIADGPHS